MLWHMAIQNAIEYSGKVAPGSVIGRIMSMRQDLRPHGKILSPLIAQKSPKQIQPVNKGLII